MMPGNQVMGTISGILHANGGWLSCLRHSGAGIYLPGVSKAQSVETEVTLGVLLTGRCISYIFITYFSSNAVGVTFESTVRHELDNKAVIYSFN